MIHAVELENFKGVGAKTRVEFAPVTLLFGANNAGKSTVLQALLFVHEVLRRGTPEVDRTELGQDILELGGFARMVHGHDKEQSITVRVEFGTGGTLNRFGRTLEQHPFPDLDDDITAAWVEFRARYRSAVGGAVVEAAKIGVGDEPLAWVELGGTLREGEPLLVQLNLGHPVLGEAAREVGQAWEALALDVSGGGFGDGSGLGFGQGGTLDGGGFGDGRPLPVFAVARARLSALAPIDEPLRLVVTEEEAASPEAPTHVLLGQIQTFLEMIVLGIPGQLADRLGKALYVGPLRAVPPRGFLFERTGRLSKWADGLAAWEALLADRGSLVDSANGWLSRLGAGCKIVVQQLLDQKASAEDIATEHVDASVRRLLLETGSGSLVLPSELGAGISQVVPIIVASLMPTRSGLVMIEQPEIHVHPALQVGLGDLIIEASRERQVIVETHSEHIVLRLLRRIRETTGHELPPGAPEFDSDRLRVNHVENTAGTVQVRGLRVSDAGEFIDRWPHGFFEERVKEVF